VDKAVKGWLIGLVGLNGCGFLIALVVVFVAIGMLYPSSAPANENGGSGTGGGDLAEYDSMTAAQIKTFLIKKRSPFVTMAENEGSDVGVEIASATEEFKINPAFMLGIFGIESTFGTAYGGDNLSVDNKNPGNTKMGAGGQYAEYNLGIIGHDSQGHTIFSSTKEGWRGMAATLRVQFLDRNQCTTIECIASTYLTGNKDNWVRAVKQFMEEALNTKV